MKEIEYTDLDGIKHDIQVFESNLNGESVFTVHKDGYFFVDLVQDEEGVWIELYNGKTKRSDEYGRLIPQ